MTSGTSPQPVLVPIPSAPAGLARNRKVGEGVRAEWQDRPEMPMAYASNRCHGAWQGWQSGAGDASPVPGVP
jgi:hypothetical protein